MWLLILFFLVPSVPSVSNAALTPEEKIAVRKVIAHAISPSRIESRLERVANLTDEQVRALIAQDEANQAIENQIKTLRSQINPIIVEAQ